jgi:pimeloyl-ACP methyl ester carboxylesterase
MRSILEFDKLGMTSTYLETVEPVPPTAGPRIIQYQGPLAVNEISATIDLFGGGGIVSSTRDLNNFFAALAGGKVFDKPETFELMKTVNTPFAEYGKGINNFLNGETECVGHEGFWGVRATTCPSADVTISIFVTQATSPALDEMRELEKTVLTALGVTTEKQKSPTATPASAERMLQHKATLTSELCPKDLGLKAACGRATVPLDWSKPSVASTKLWYAHVPASEGPSTGTLIPFHGGPGEALSTIVAQFAVPFGALPDRDQLYVDVRGVGRSDRLDCEAFGKETPFQIGEAQVKTVAKCAEQQGTNRDYYNTVSITLDVESIRRALELPKPSLVAFSYGTWVASTYTALFPELVQATVLDGAFPLEFDPWAGDLVNSIDKVLALHCTRTKLCSARKMRAQIKKVTADLERKPQPIPGRAELLTSTTFARITLVSLDTSEFSYFGAVEAAVQGDYKALSELSVKELASEPTNPVGRSIGTLTAVSCNDYPPPFDLADDLATRRVEYQSRKSSLSQEYFGLFTPDQWLASDTDPQRGRCPKRTPSSASQHMDPFQKFSCWSSTVMLISKLRSSVPGLLPTSSPPASW